MVRPSASKIASTFVGPGSKPYTTAASSTLVSSTLAWDSSVDLDQDSCCYYYYYSCYYYYYYNYSYYCYYYHYYYCCYSDNN